MNSLYTELVTSPTAPVERKSSPSLTMAMIKILLLPDLVPLVALNGVQGNYTDMIFIMVHLVHLCNAV